MARQASSTCPLVKDIVNVFAPDRGEIVVDEAILDLDGAPVDRPPEEAAEATALVAAREGWRSAGVAAPDEAGQTAEPVDGRGILRHPKPRTPRAQD